MRITHRRRGLSVLLLVAIALSIPTMALAMTDAELAQYETTLGKALDIIDQANAKAARNIEAVEEAETDKIFDSLVERTNEQMLTVLCKLKPLVEELTRLSGQEHWARCEYVLVTNHHLNRSALVDPIHLTSSGD